MRIKFLLSTTFIFISILSLANNLQIGTITHTESGSNHYLNFTISWNNSWRVTSGPGNWDATWVFVKRRDCSALDWRHVNLAAQDTSHTAGTPLFVDAYTDKKGVMIYRAADGSGNISNVNIQLKLDSVPAGNYDYQVFGIEMVYVPQGSFYVGDGVSQNTLKTGTTSNPYKITNEGTISLSTLGPNLWADGAIGGGNLLPEFPKGFNAFYCMKYEISQGQYADFLNNIAQDAAAIRAIPYMNLYRFNMTGIWPQFTATAPNQACNWIGFRDIAAYFDWSALSPMTELEFEKSCRGSENIPLAGEFAWGSTTVTDADSIVAGTSGLSTEVCWNTVGIGSGLANYGSDGVIGPLRCGFAAKSGTTRFESGASFYGIMELSGNVYERCYGVYGPAIGHNFNGSHGDGEISVTPNPGFANQGWPVESAVVLSVESNVIAYRGGSWYSGLNNELRISDRSLAVTNLFAGADGVGRSGFFGGRGVSRRQQ